MAANLKNSERGHRGQLRTLPQEITTIRDKIVDRFQDAPLSEIAAFVRKVLAQEKNQINRIAALAARVVLIRNYVNELSGLGPLTVSSNPTPSDIEGEEQNTSPIAMVAELETEVHAGMHRVRLIEDSIVNGVAFPKGVVIDVKEADATRLIDSGKAEDTVKDTQTAAAETPPGDPISEEADSEETASEETGAEEVAAETSVDASPEEASSEEASSEEAASEETISDETSTEDAISDDEGASDDEADTDANSNAPKA